MIAGPAARSVGRPTGRPPVLVKGGVSYEAEALALFARFSSPPSVVRKAAINAAIKALKAAGVWTKLDGYVPYAAADAQAGTRNWIQDAYNPAPQNSPAFSADRGFTGDGSGSYLDTGFVPATAGGKFALNSAHIGFFSRSAGQSNGVELGARNGASAGQVLTQVRTTTNNSIHRVNQDASGAIISGTMMDGSGHFIARRSAAGATEYFRNNVSLITGSSPATALPAYSLVSHAVNQAGVIAAFSSRELALIHWGTTLTDADIAAITSISLTYLQAVGAA